MDNLHTIENAPKEGLLGRICEAINNNWASFMAIKGDDIIEFDTTNENAPRIYWNSDLDGEAEINIDSFAYKATATPNGSTFYVTMLGGTVQPLLGNVAVLDSQEWTSISANTYFWVEYIPGTSPSHQHNSVPFSIVNWALCWGSSIPQQSESQSIDGTPLTIFPIFKVDLYAPNSIIQYHVGGIYVPTVTNVIQIQTANGGGS